MPSLYKVLYCTLLYTHEYTDYLVFLSHFIFLTYLNKITVLFLKKKKKNLTNCAMFGTCFYQSPHFFFFFCLSSPHYSTLYCSFSFYHSPSCFGFASSHYSLPYRYSSSNHFSPFFFGISSPHYSLPYYQSSSIQILTLIFYIFFSINLLLFLVHFSLPFSTCLAPKKKKKGVISLSLSLSLSLPFSSFFWWIFIFYFFILYSFLQHRFELMSCCVFGTVFWVDVSWCCVS